jgi:hypothetical protein
MSEFLPAKGIVRQWVWHLWTPKILLTDDQASCFHRTCRRTILWMDFRGLEVNSKLDTVLSVECRWQKVIFKLALNDESKTPVARSHRSNIGIFGKPCQARLEIFPGFEHLMDIILVTYIFVEKSRKDRERDGERHWYHVGVSRSCK